VRRVAVVIEYLLLFTPACAVDINRWGVWFVQHQRVFVLINDYEWRHTGIQVLLVKLCATNRDGGAVWPSLLVCEVVAVFQHPASETFSRLPSIAGGFASGELAV